MSILFGLISLILGLHFLKDNLYVSIGLTLLFVIFIIYRFKWGKVTLYLSLFVLGCLFSNLPREYNNPNQVYSGVVVLSKQNYFLLYSHGERFYIYEKDNEREIGDFLEVKGQPKIYESTTYESQIDFNQYLQNKGVKRTIAVDDITLLFQNPVRLFSYQKYFLSKLNENAAPLVDAMLFNTKDYGSNVFTVATSINLIFLLSTTGIYFSFFLRLLKKLIYLKFEERESHILSLLVVSPYVFLSFPKVGVLRIFLVNLLNIPKKDPNEPKKLNFLSKLSISHFILLILNPYWAYDSGFLIGLCLTVFLYFFRISYKTTIYFKSKMVTPTLVFLLLQPFSSFRSGSLHLFQFFEQMLLIPINEFFIVLSLIGFIGVPIYFIINFFGNFIYQTLLLFEKIDLTIPFADYGEIYIVLFYVLSVIGLYLFEAKRYRHVKYVGLVTFGLFLLGITPIQPMITSGVYFVNVGQGDSIIIQDHFHAVMIDTGGNLSFDMAKRTLIPYMNKKHIYHLDALIATHDDFDHSGTVESLRNNFTVRQYLSTKDDFPYQVGNILLTNLNIYEGKDENASSLVLYLDFYGTKYLFTGDATKEIEQKIIKDNPTLECDILKVGHHGSKTSTDEGFIQQIKPKEAIISCGKKNKFGHPDQVTLDTLNRYDVKIRRTDTEGTISYLSYFVY